MWKCLLAVSSCHLFFLFDHIAHLSILFLPLYFHSALGAMRYLSAPSSLKYLFYLVVFFRHRDLVFRLKCMVWVPPFGYQVPFQSIRVMLSLNRLGSHLSRRILWSSKLRSCLQTLPGMLLKKLIGSFCFSRWNVIRVFITFSVYLSLNFRFRITRSWSLLMSAPVYLLVWARLILDLNCLGTRMTIWLHVFPIGAIQVVLLDSLCG